MINFKKGEKFSKQLDLDDPLALYRNKFHIPKSQKHGNDLIYFLGNSLGLQPKTAKKAVLDEMENWETLASRGHSHGNRPWSIYEKNLNKKLANIVGGLESEVVAMNSLTINLHLLMITFYRPSKERYKILIEEKAFPSDQYAIASQVQLHGLNPKDAIIKIKARKGENTIHHEDIQKLIETEGDSIALILIGGINYYSGQLFNIKKITNIGQEKGCIVGFDLAHAAGNVELKLHNWNVDFAAWCNYKYLNGGPGSIGSIFIHERHALRTDLQRLTGWWGHERESRFKMPSKFKPILGAEGWQISNINILSAASLISSLDIFKESGLISLIKKSIKMADYLEFLLDDLNSKNVFEIITPRNKKERGSQTSLLFHLKGKKVFQQLIENDVICDYREPNLIRLAPVPLYNSFNEIYKFVKILNTIICNVK